VRRPPLFPMRKRLFMASLLFAFLFPSATWIQAAGCALLLLLFNTMILPWLDVDVSGRHAAAQPPPDPLLNEGGGTRTARGTYIPAKSAGTPPARGYLIKLASLIPSRVASDPSPGPPRLKNAGGGPPSPQGRGLDIPFSNPLPTGEGKEPSPVTLRTPTGIILYPVSVLALIVLYRNHLHIAAAAWAIMALGDGMATVVGEAARRQFVAGRQAQETTA